MAPRAIGALLAILAAIAFVVSIASSAWWAGFPTIEGRTYDKKHLRVGPLGATGCNTGGDGLCEAVPLGETSQIVANIELAAIGLAIILAFALAVTAWTIGDRRRGVANATVAVTLIAAAGGAALLALGPEIATEGHAVSVPVGWGTYVFGGAALCSLIASAITRTLEPEPLRLKPGVAHDPNNAGYVPEAQSPALPMTPPPYLRDQVKALTGYTPTPDRVNPPGLPKPADASPGSNPFAASHPASDPVGSASPGSNPFSAPHPGSNPFGSAAPGSNPFSAPHPGSNPAASAQPRGELMPQPGDPLGPPVDPFARTAPRDQHLGPEAPPMAPPPNRARPASAAPPRSRPPSVAPAPLDWSVPPQDGRTPGTTQRPPGGRPNPPQSGSRSSSPSNPPPLGSRPASPSNPPPLGSRPGSPSNPPPLGSRSSSPSNPPPLGSRPAAPPSTIGRSTSPLGSLPGRPNTPSAASPVRAAALGGPRTHTPAPGVPMPDRSKTPSIGPTSRSDTTPVPVVGQRARTVPGPGTDSLATPLTSPAHEPVGEPESRPSAPTLAHAIPPMPSPDNLPAPSILPARDVTTVEIDAEAKAAAAEATARGTLDPRIAARRLSTQARTGTQGTIGEDTAIGVDISGMESRATTTVGLDAVPRDNVARAVTTGVDVIAAPPARIITGVERALSTMQHRVARAPTDDPFDTERAHLYVPADGPLTDELVSPRSAEISVVMADDAPFTDVHDVPSSTELADELAAHSTAGAIGEVTDMNRAPDLLPPRESQSTPIPTFHGSSQLPMSTASSSLPPPRTVETAPSGPTPACPQCESPMAWVDEHLRFYCKQCRMYF